MEELTDKVAWRTVFEVKLGMMTQAYSPSYVARSLEPKSLRPAQVT